MIKGFLPILYTSAGVSVAAVTGYAVVEPEAFFGPGKEIVIQAEPEKEEVPVAKLVPEPVAEEPAEIEQPAVAEPEVVIPAFTLLRVEKDGSVVVAGTGPADSEITLFDESTELGRTQTGSQGDFVFVLDNPLSPGVHQLTLRAQPKDGETVYSVEAGLITIPEPDTKEEVLVLVAEPGEPTRILQKPKVKEPEKVVFEPVVEEPVVEEPVSEEVEVAVATQPEVAVAEPEVTETPVAKEPEVILIEAADIESGKIFIAGKGEGGNGVNVYLDDKFLGSVQIRSNGAFLYEGRHKIDAGRYNVRADMTSRQNGEVLARAEVVLIHEPVSTVASSDVEPVTEPVEDSSNTEVEETEVAEVSAIEEPKEIRTGSAVIIRQGDNLWSIAHRNYGDGVRYTTIFEANRDQIRDPHLIYPGQVFKIPEKTEESNG